MLLTYNGTAWIFSVQNWEKEPRKIVIEQYQNPVEQILNPDTPCPVPNTGGGEVWPSKGLGCSTTMLLLVVALTASLLSDCGLFLWIFSTKFLSSWFLWIPGLFNALLAFLCALWWTLPDHLGILLKSGLRLLYDILVAFFFFFNQPHRNDARIFQQLQQELIPLVS